MTIPTIAELLKYADLQMAAEAFLVNESDSQINLGNKIDGGASNDTWKTRSNQQIGTATKASGGKEKSESSFWLARRTWQLFIIAVLAAGTSTYASNIDSYPVADTRNLTIFDPLPAPKEKLEETILDTDVVVVGRVEKYVYMGREKSEHGQEFTQNSVESPRALFGMVKICYVLHQKTSYGLKIGKTIPVGPIDPNFANRLFQSPYVFLLKKLWTSDANGKRLLTFWPFNDPLPISEEAAVRKAIYNARNPPYLWR
jgi:hypothetical protein